MHSMTIKILKIIQKIYKTRELNKSLFFKKNSHITTLL